MSGTVSQNTQNDKRLSWPLNDQLHMWLLHIMSAVMTTLTKNLAFKVTKKHAID